MVNYYVYAKDFSGSTNGLKHYHTNGLETFKQFKNDVENIEKTLSAAGEETESKIIYLHWGDECYEVDELRTIESYHKMEGNMGTEPATIVEWLKLHYDICDGNNKIKLLYIITDGLIGSSSARYCFELNHDMNYETVVFHAFNQCLSSIDLSVAASFFKSRCKVYRNYELFDDIDITEEFDYDKINVDNFDVEKENMKSYIKLKYIKQNNHDVVALKEIENLKKLRNRLLRSSDLTSKLHKDASDLNTKDRYIFIEEFKKTKWYRTLYSLGQDMKVNIEQAISTMINYITSEKKSYSFDAIKFDMSYNKPIEEEPVVVDVNFEPEQEIEFPDIVMYEDKGIPVIILTEFNLLDKLIFHTKMEDVEVSPASFSKFKTMMDIPLLLMKDEDISESIGYFYTLNVYKQLLESGHKTEPRTRKPFHGGLVLTDSEQFDKYNDYILSATYFDSKKIKYNIGLFYYVLWKNCEKKEWMAENVIDRFKKYVMRRINTTVCKIGLTSLPLDPSENVLLPTALWYCVEISSRLFKDDPKNFSQERLRLLGGGAQNCIEILQYLNYENYLDMEFINKRIDIIRHVMKLKRIPTYREKVYYLLKMVFKNVNGFLVSVIENPHNIQKLNYLKLNHKDMLRDDSIEEKVNLNDYVHLLYHVEDFENGKSKVNICEKTLRPFFTIDENNSFYSELAQITKNVVITNNDNKEKAQVTHEAIESLQLVKLLSTYNLFINCVKHSEKYPTLSEYIDFILQKKKYHEDLVTIFTPLDYSRIEYTHSHYLSVVSQVEIKKFIEITKQYVNRIDRIKAEEILKFTDNDDIKKFISSEESKVNLNKNTKS